MKASSKTSARHQQDISADMLQTTSSVTSLTFQHPPIQLNKPAAPSSQLSNLMRQMGWHFVNLGHQPI
jgi:hypothetical protein